MPHSCQDKLEMPCKGSVHFDVHPGRLGYGAAWQGGPTLRVAQCKLVLLCEQYYYAMEDYVSARQQQGAKWNWSTYRPGPIIGYSLGYESPP